MSLWSWLRTRRLSLDDDDFEEEVRAHLAMAERERLEDGADLDTARYAALKEFGNVTLTTEAARRVWTPRWLDAAREVLADAAYATRSLARAPAFALTVVLVLGVGIGLNATVFTVLKSMALAPLAGVPGSARIHVLFRETSAGRQLRLSYPDFRYLRERDGAFADLMGSAYFDAFLGRGRGAHPVGAEIVTGNYFRVLGVRASLGRPILPSDEVAAGRHPVAVISDGLWRRDFAADPQVVGRTMYLNGYPLTVVGVADAAFHGTIVSYDVDVFVPVTMAGELGVANAGAPRSDVLADRAAGLLVPHGFLRAGTSLSSASDQANAMWASRARERGLAVPAESLVVLPFWRSPNGAQSHLVPLLTALGAMGLLVMLIACANIAGLVLVRGVARRGEIAVRLALGASRLRIVRLLVVENLLLALPGAALGVLLASYTVPLLVEYCEQVAAPQRLYFNVTMDGLVIAFAALVACASALAFGLVPALQSSRVDLVTAINEDASPRGAARGALRGGLVVAQVAVSLLLLVGAGLVMRSADAARRADPGFDSGRVSMLSFDLRQNGYDEARGLAFLRELLRTARSGPGVESATLAAYAPLAFLDTPARRLEIDGYVPRRGEDLAVLNNTVGPDYFQTLRIPVEAGRGILGGDDAGARPVAVVNATLAARYWGSAERAIGRRLRLGDGEWRTVVGVARDLKYVRIDEAPRPYVYVPLLQAYRSTVILHTRGPAPVDALVTQARDRLAALDGELPVIAAQSLVESTRGAFLFLDFAAVMLLAFGVAGMVLAALGTYGLVSYSVTQSTHEIGIRMALGASARSIVRVFLARGVRLGAIGAALGTGGALALSSLVGSVLYGVSPTDAVAFTQALAIVFVVVIAAAVVPSWRAAGVDPLKALRHQ